jgi:hypothetical protein
MEENHLEESIESNGDVEENNFLPSSISDEEKGELFRELTTILSRKWVKERVTVFGCSELDLLLATRFDIQTLRETIDEYRSFVHILGLNVIEYEIDGEKWYCLRSSHYAPSDLQSAELIVLGTIIAYLEGEKQEPITTERIKEKLVVTGRMKEYLVENSLRRLSRLGYIKKNHSVWEYNYRTYIEFGEEEREKIVKEFRRI